MDEDYRATLGSQIVHVYVGAGYKTHQFSRGLNSDRLNGEFIVIIVNGRQRTRHHSINTPSDWVLRFINAEDGWL